MEVSIPIKIICFNLFFCTGAAAVTASVVVAAVVYIITLINSSNKRVREYAVAYIQPSLFHSNLFSILFFHVMLKTKHLNCGKCISAMRITITFNEFLI